MRTLIADASIGVKPAVRADKPYTNPNAPALAMIPRPSTTSRRRACSRSTGSDAVTATASAQERLAAGPVAHDLQRVEIARVARGMKEAGAALGRALPDPPALVHVERRGLRLDLVGQPVLRSRDPFDGGGAVGLRLARVGIVLADVRAHCPSPSRDSRTGGGLV